MMAQQLNSGVLSMEANIDCQVISAAPGKACVVTSSCALPCGEAPDALGRVRGASPLGYGWGLCGWFL